MSSDDRYVVVAELSVSIQRQDLRDLEYLRRCHPEVGIIDHLLTLTNDKIAQKEDG